MPRLHSLSPERQHLSTADSASHLQSSTFMSTHPPSPPPAGYFATLLRTNLRTPLPTPGPPPDIVTHRIHRGTNAAELSRTTISNLPAGHDILWLPAGVTYMVVGYCCWVLLCHCQVRVCVCACVWGGKWGGLQGFNIGGIQEVCVCARARVCACVCVFVCVRVRACVCVGGGGCLLQTQSKHSAQPDHRAQERCGIDHCPGCP